jgi:tRNA pseudouridine38-40 synthase
VSDSLRYKLTLAYRGTRYHGWQTQLAVPTYKGDQALGEEIPTVQGLLRTAVAGVVGHPINLVGSSRTDAGVHAKGQVAHFDTTSTQIPMEGLRRAVNARLPDDILIRTMEPVSVSFDAIRNTISKRYQYFIWNAPDRPVFSGDLCWHRWQTLDIDAMKAAAAQLVGTHDFASFAKTGHGRENTVRTVLSCDVTRRSPRLIIAVEGTGFLWQMVRIIVGTLVEVGLSRYGPAEVKQMLDAKDRREGGPTAPPQGLYLQWIRYGDT